MPGHRALAVARERGSATIINLAIIACILLLLGALAASVGQAAAKGHARALADIAAISVAQRGTCEAAEQVVQRNRKYSLTVRRCISDGWHAQVEVGRTFPLEVSATSRAGPGWSDP